MRPILHHSFSLATLSKVATVMAAMLFMPLAQASNNALGLDSSLNLLAFGDFSASGSDVQGRVAVGGNASMSNYSTNAVNGGAPYSGAGLTVGGNLTFGSGSVNGNTLVGGNLNVLGGNSFGGNVQVVNNLYANNNWLTASSISYGGTASGIQDWQNPAPVQVAPGSVQLGINFANEKTRLTNLSQSFDSLANTGTSSNSWGTIVLNANGANLAVFDVSASDVSQNLSLANLGSNTTVLINVHGQTVDFGGHNYDNFTAGKVLFNLPEATQVSFTSGVNASFLAPLAQFTSNSGVINGQVVANSWSGSTQVNNVAFNGNIAAVPEPAEYALMLAGLATVGVFSRRRQSSSAPVLG